ncbi:MAG: hypothetical protein ACTHOM_08905 [Allomuricauda sp.]
MTDLKHYTEAFTIALKCTKDDFKIKPFNGKSSSGPMISQYKDRTYLIYDTDDLYNYAEECLTDPHLAIGLRPGDVEDLMEFTYTTKDFYGKLLSILDKEERIELSLMLGIHNATGDDFWGVCSRFADPLLYGKTIVAAGETFELEALKGELVEMFMQRGDEFLSVHVDGTFAEVILNEDTEQEKYFMIHDSEFSYD